jgi:hypothetical protein
LPNEQIEFSVKPLRLLFWISFKFKDVGAEENFISCPAAHEMGCHLCSALRGVC